MLINFKLHIFYEMLIYGQIYSWEYIYIYMYIYNDKN